MWAGHELGKLHIKIYLKIIGVDGLFLEEVAVVRAA